MNDNRITLGIAGSRTYCNYEVFERRLNELVATHGWTIDAIVSGGAQGVDKMAERYAKEHKLKMQVLPANWQKYGKSAGYIRSVDIVNLSDVVVAFPTPDSKGTRHTITIAKEKKKPVYVFEVV